MGDVTFTSLILRKTHDASKTAIAHISRVSKACGCDGQVDYGGRMPTIMMRISAGEEAKYVQRLCKYLKVVHAKGKEPERDQRSVRGLNPV